MRLQKKENARRQTKRRMLLTRNMPLLDAKTCQASTTNIIPNTYIRKTLVVHVKPMDVMCCGDPAPITIQITQTITNQWFLPPIALITKPLDIVMVPVMEKIVVAPAEDALVITMVTEIATTSQALVTTKARITITSLLTSCGFVFVSGF